MQARRFWPPIKHKLLYANLIVYGVTVVLALMFHHELIWAQKTLRSYLYSGKFEPPADMLLMQDAIKYFKTDQDTKRGQYLLERALEIDPYSKARLLLGDYYLRAGDDDKALVCYEHYRSIDPSLLGVYKVLGRILAKKQDYKAIDQLLTEGLGHFRRRVELYQPHYDPTAPKQFNLKAMRVYNMSKKGLEFLEKMQEQSSDFK